MANMKKYSRLYRDDLEEALHGASQELASIVDYIDGAIDVMAASCAKSDSVIGAGALRVILEGIQRRAARLREQISPEEIRPDLVPYTCTLTGEPVIYKAGDLSDQCADIAPAATATA